MTNRSGLGPDLRALVWASVAYGLFYGGFFLKSLLSGDYIAPSDSFDFGLSAYLSPPTFWTDWLYSGYPVAADPQALTWYPLFRLVRGLDLGWNTFILSPYLIASSGCFLLVRRVTGSSLAGLFGGFVFGFSGVLMSHISHFNQIHTAAWLPFVIYGLQLVREGHHRVGAVVGASAFGLMVLSGHPQVVVYTGYLSVAVVGGWTLIDRSTTHTAWPRLAWSAAVFLLGAGLAAIVVLPMLELAGFSTRVEPNWEVYSSKALPVGQLLTLVFPLVFGGYRTAEHTVPYLGESSPGEMTNYVGLLPILLAVAGAAIASPRRSDLRLWLGVALVGTILSLGEATPLHGLFFHAPGYSTFRVPARHFFVVSFCVAVASGFSFAELLATPTVRRRFVSLGGAALLGVTLIVVGFAVRTPDVRTLIAENPIYPTWALGLPFAIAALACFVTWTGRAWPAALVGGLLVAVHLGDMVLFHYVMPGYRFEYAEIAPSKTIPHPRVAALGAKAWASRERIMAVDGTRNPFLRPNFTRPWGVPAAGGTGSLGMKPYRDVMRMGGPGDVYPDLLSAAHRGLDLFRVGYAFVPVTWLSNPDVVLPDDRWVAVEELQFEERDPDSRYVVYRNRRTLPPAWCVPIAVEVDDDAALRVLASGHLPDDSPFDPRREVLVRPDDVLNGGLTGWLDLAGQPPRGGVSAPASVVSAFSEEGVRRHLVATESACILVASDVFYPWWRVTVDGAPTSPVQVNRAMVGIPLDAGTHQVRMWIQPTSVWIGAGVSGLSTLIWLGLIGWRLRRCAPRASQM